MIGDRIPPEIASQIFVFCVPQNPHVVTAVCKLWRAIAWSTPQLWTNISILINTKSSLANKVDLAIGWVARSGQLPLDIHLTYSLTSLHHGPHEYSRLYPLIDVLQLHASRWRTLDLFLPPSCYRRFLCPSTVASSLEVLHLNHYLDLATKSRSKFDLVNIVPSPTSVIMTRFTMETINIHWNNVRNLEIYNTTVEDVLQILSVASRVEHCKFDRVMFADEDNRLPFTTKITLSHLRTLTFVCDDESECHFLELFIAPRLQELDISFTETELPTDVLISFFARSSCPLIKLGLDRFFVQEANSLIDFLRGAPFSLRQLYINPSRTGRHPAMTDDVLAIFLESIPSVDGGGNEISEQHDGITKLILPQLEVFEYCGRRTFSWKNLLQVLTPHRPLTTLKVSVKEWECRTMNDKEALLQLRHLRTLGFTIELRYLHGWVPHVGKPLAADIVKLSMREFGIEASAEDRSNGPSERYMDI